MASDAAKSLSNEPEIGEEEWKLRLDLAACYRMIAYYGWDDLIYTHVSARIPGPHMHFLINPFGLMFEEITASSLLKVDLEGNIVTPSEYIMNPAGFTYGGMALRDCLRAVRLPYVEVHMTNIERRGTRSLTIAEADGAIIGLGIDSYRLGLDAIVAVLRHRSTV